MRRDELWQQGDVEDADLGIEQVGEEPGAKRLGCGSWVLLGRQPRATSSDR